jgi:hypothetical protein
MIKTEAHCMSLQEQLKELNKLHTLLKAASSLAAKMKILDTQSEVQRFFLQQTPLKNYIKSLCEEKAYALKSVLAIGQGPQVFQSTEEITELTEHYDRLLKMLLELEKSYAAIGGIIGYHLNILKLIVTKQLPIEPVPQGTVYRRPPGIDLSEDSEEVRRAIRQGINAMTTIAEIYPVGGAGDRLDLHHEKTGEALPAAELLFCGKTLLEGLIRDLQAREYVYYKIHGKQLNTPIAMMTSEEKNNHQHITEICKQHQWFGRTQENFYFFIQPLIPMVTIKGDWVVQSPLQIMLKPGGHGVIWTLALNSGVFDKLQEHNCHQALVRQINNPIAGTDQGLWALAGIGSHEHKAFGFATCPRHLNTSEGMDVLIEKQVNDGFEYRISNIEYTEFEHHGINDVPEAPGSPYSLFPANTNILFVDLNVIRATLPLYPIPGMLINMKHKISCVGSDGNQEEIEAGRLESTMQNIADYIIDHSPRQLSSISPADLKTFVTYNERRKTISVTKKTYHAGADIRETPQGCLYELLQNHYDLFSHYCRMHLPPVGTEEEYIQKGPPFYILFNPALGPLYHIIAQKIQSGRLAYGAEMQLEIAELEMRDLTLSGSLLITADTLLGRKKHGVIAYGEETGKCVLHHVTIDNKGIDRGAANQYWKNQIIRHESLQITLRGNAEFFAENVTFTGSHQIDVPDGHRMVVGTVEGNLNFRLEKIAAPTWYWKYSFDPEDRITLTK